MWGQVEGVTKIEIAKKTLTKINRSIKRAVEEIRMEEAASTIVLVSDGEEACLIECPSHSWCMVSRRQPLDRGYSVVFVHDSAVKMQQNGPNWPYIGCVNNESPLEGARI